MRRKESGLGRLVPAICVAVAAWAGPALANPQGAIVAGGSAQIIQTSPSQVTIEQSSSRAVIDWRSFSVGAGERTVFNQPSSSALAVNRVTGADPSDIAGRVSANGQIVLVNPNGIVFERGSRIDAAGFIATTTGISNRDAMAGKLSFTHPSRSPNAAVVNHGRITVKEGGLAALVAPAVVNDGVIRARLGTAELAAGQTFTLDLAGDHLVNFAVDAPVLNRTTAPDGTPISAAITNSGRIIANGGTVELSVDAAKGVVDRAINMTGIVEAKTVRNQSGTIVLDGGDTGVTRVSGRLDASGTAAGQSGGAISVTGHIVALRGAVLEASGADGGGTIAVGGNTQGAGPLRNAARTSIDKRSTLRADALDGGPGGSVTVWSQERTRFAGAISARGGANGGDGGNAEVSSHGVLAFGGAADLRAPAGKIGTLLLDPNDVVIQNGGTSARPLLGTSVITTGDLQNQLGDGNVTITTGQPAIGNQPGNITVASDISWSSGATLTLSAFNNIAVNGKIVSTNGGSTVLRADNTGTGTGTITFGIGGAISAQGGSVALFFNSNDNTNNQAINAQSYATMQSYAGNVALTSGATLSQFALVNTAFDLANINNNTTASYALGRDIDASPIADFPMIGGFSGVFDGQNQAIDNLTINSAGSNVGLFTVTNGGSTVRNLRLTNASVTATAASSDVGGLVGIANGAIANVSISGTINAPNGFAVGGLVGQTGQTGAGNGSVKQSSSSAAVTGFSDAGGLVGVTNAGNSISQSFATGIVTAIGNAGGLVGQNVGSITDSYATSSVSGNAAGGLIGLDSRPPTSAVSSVYAAGPVTGTAAAGGLVGEEAGIAATMTNAYWDKQTSGRTDPTGTGTLTGAVSQTTGSLQNQVLPSGFDPSVWTVSSGTYPSLIGPGQTVSGTVFSGPGGLPLAGATVRLLVGGSDTGLTAATNAAGFYSFSLPGSTIPTSGSGVVVVLTAGGSGNAFFDGATGSLGNLDVYGSGFLTVYSAATTLSGAATALRAATSGISSKDKVGDSLLFNPGNTTTLAVNSGAGLWINDTAAAFSIDLPVGNSGVTMLFAGTGAVSETAVAGVRADGLLLLGNGATYNLGGTTANSIGTLAANTGPVTVASGGPGNLVDLRTGTVLGIAGVESAGIVSISAGRNLTLGSGAPVSGTGAGTAVTLVAGGAFTNNAGANAIQTGGGGRFLVYSQNPANDNRGGLAYAFKQYNATLASTVLGAGNGFLYATAPVASLTGVTKTYDGTNAIPTGPGGFTFSGAIDGDTVTLTGATGTYDTRNAGTGKTVSVTGLGVAEATDSTGAQVFGYQVAPTAPLNTLGTITPAPLTVTAAANTKTYDGTLSATALPTITSGALAAGDSAALTESYATRNAGSGLTLSPAALIADGNNGANYAVTLVAKAAGTITPAALTVTAAANTKTYDGTLSAAGLPAITGGALVAGDSAALTESYATRNAGTGLTLNPAALISDGNNGANYAVTLVAKAAGTITPAALTVTAAANTKTYDGMLSAAGLPAITDGALVAGDSATLTESYATRNAGTGLTLNPAALISDGNNGANYAVTLIAKAAGTITPAALTVTATANTRTYDGTPSAAALPTITAGALAPGDSVALSETYASRNAGSGLTLNPAALIADGNSGANYAVTLVTKAAGTIIPAPLAVVAEDATRDFGKPNPAFAALVLGLVPGDSAAAVGLSLTTTATVASQPGSYPITPGIVSTNYAPVLIPGTLLVNAAQLSAQPTVVAAALQQTGATETQEDEQPQSQGHRRRKGAEQHRDRPLPIVQGYDAKVTAPRQALFVVVPNANGTVGAISVDDGRSVTLLDHAYAASEMRDGEAAAAQIGPDEVNLIFGGALNARSGRQ